MLLSSLGKSDANFKAICDFSHTLVELSASVLRQLWQSQENPQRSASQVQEQVPSAVRHLSQINLPIKMSLQFSECMYFLEAGIRNDKVYDLAKHMHVFCRPLLLSRRICILYEMGILLREFLDLTTICILFVATENPAPKKKISRKINLSKISHL